MVPEVVGFSMSLRALKTYHLRAMKTYHLKKGPFLEVVGFWGVPPPCQGKPTTSKRGPFSEAVGFHGTEVAPGNLPPQKGTPF